MPNLTDLAYLGGLTLGAPYVAWRCATNARFRAELRLGARLFGEQVPQPVRDALKDRPAPIWIHAASVGEVNAARTFIEAVQGRFPDRPWVISTFTQTGFERARTLYGEEHVLRYPADFSWRVADVLDTVAPAALVLIELELWPNMLRATHRRGIPTLVINGRITESAVRGLKWFGRVLGAFWRESPDLFCVQDAVYADRLRALGVPDDRLRVTGTMKYDTVTDSVDPDRRAALRDWIGLADDAPLLVGGSTWPGEEAILLDVYARLRESHPTLRLLLAPRHTERGAAVAGLVAAAGLKPVRRSEESLAGSASDWPESSAGTDQPSDAASDADGKGVRHYFAGEIEPDPFSSPDRDLDIVPILDTIGELAVAYSLATVAFVGRSLGDGDSRGGQNMLEPAALGVPTLYGPHTENFREDAQRLADAGGGAVVPDADALLGAVAALLEDGDRCRRMADSARKVINENRGATQRHVEALAHCLPDTSGGDKLMRKDA